jgi:hypothetical protein
MMDLDELETETKSITELTFHYELQISLTLPHAITDLLTLKQVK